MRTDIRTDGQDDVAKLFRFDTLNALLSCEIVIIRLYLIVNNISACISMNLLTCTHRSKVVVQRLDCVILQQTETSVSPRTSSAI